MKQRRSQLAIDQKRAAQNRASRKTTAQLVLEERETIIDQMVTQSVSLNAFPQPYADRERSFTLELAVYPDFETAHFYKRPYLHNEKGERQDVELRTYELEAFAEAVTELVTIARERGFLP